jgi:membrane-associated phospholipid phosphatase
VVVKRIPAIRASISTTVSCRAFCAGLTLLVLALPVTSSLAGEFLSAGEVAAVSGGSAATFWLGYRAKNCDSTRAPLLKGPLPLESSIQTFFGGHYQSGKRNIFDDDMGGAITPIAMGTMLSAADLAWPQGEREKAALQDCFLFLCGLAATDGVTGIAKQLVSRPRPYMTLVPIDQVVRRGFQSDRTSFFSGHASSAFFSAAFLNLRLRCIMRNELTSDEYHNWRWAPPSLLFGWASVVGLSRIHAYKHYVSDVLVGSLAGYLIAELFFSFNESRAAYSSAPGSSEILLRLHFPL